MAGFEQTARTARLDNGWGKFTNTAQRARFVGVNVNDRQGHRPSRTLVCVLPSHVYAQAEWRVSVCDQQERVGGYS